MDNTTDVNSVCVIGGGVAGLVTAKALLSRGFSVSVFEERGEIGGLWSDNYYNVAVQADKILYEYPEKRFPENVSRLASATEILDYLNEFAREHNVLPCCKLRHKIIEVSRPKEFAPWTVTYTNSGGEMLREDFDFVVVCTGLLGNPSIPEFRGLANFKGRVLHSTEWKSPQEFNGKKVVVIGNGKGATDAVVGALSPARQVDQVVRKKQWYLPLDFFGIIPFQNVLTIRAIGFMSPGFDASSGIWGKLLEWIVAPFIWLLTHLLALVFAYHSGFPSHLLPDVTYQLEGGATQIPKPAYYEAVRSGKVVVHVTGVKAFTEHAIVLENWETIDADVVVMATGYKQDFPFLGHAVKEKLEYDSDGLWLYRQILHPEIPGLAFIGPNVSTYLSSCTFSLQAAWIARMLTKEMKVPSRSAMWKSIEKVKGVGRRKLAYDPKRSTSINARTIKYHDMLCRDMGREPRRKGLLGTFLDYFAPAYPLTYKHIVDG